MISPRRSRLAIALLAALVALAALTVPAPVADAGGYEHNSGKSKKRGKHGHHGHRHHGFGGKDFTLTLLHNNDGESKLATGDSIAGYGGAARFATVVERLREQADRKPRRGHRGTLLVSSGDNFLEA